MSWRRRRSIARSQLWRLAIPATLADLSGNSSRTRSPSFAAYGSADSFGPGYYGSASKVMGVATPR
jgi:hypothetical protein